MATIPASQNLTTYDLPYTGAQVDQALGLILNGGINQSVSDAQTSAAAAALSASGAAAQAQTATNQASNASSSASNADASATNAESWAIGGTGSREGEDTNNAKYWANKAQAAVGGGVISFSGRTGPVIPESGDYSAEMVGARPNTWMPTAAQVGAEPSGAVSTHNGAASAHAALFAAKAGKAATFTVTLPAASWASNVQTVSNALFVSGGYAYTVAPADSSFAAYATAAVRAQAVETDGFCTFVCATAPTADLTVNVLRTEVGA